MEKAMETAMVAVRAGGSRQRVEAPVWSGQGRQLPPPDITNAHAP